MVLKLDTNFVCTEKCLQVKNECSVQNAQRGHAGTVHGTSPICVHKLRNGCLQKMAVIVTNYPQVASQLAPDSGVRCNIIPVQFSLPH